MSLLWEKTTLAALLTSEREDYSQAMTSVNTEAFAEEAVWIRQAQRSDARAFENLYRLHQGRVYGICLRMTGNASEAEDCAQEAFIQAWSKLDKFRGDSAFSTWLHRIAVNAVLGRVRKSQREQDRIAAVSETSPPPLGNRRYRRNARSLGRGEQIAGRARAMFLFCTQFTATATTKPATCWASRQEHRKHNCIGQNVCSRNN